MAKNKAAQDHFVDTGKKIDVLVLGKLHKRPVLQFRDRFYAGETLTLLNPHGYEGIVWSGRTIGQLEYNANFRGLHEHRDDH